MCSDMHVLISLSQEIFQNNSVTLSYRKSLLQRPLEIACEVSPPVSQRARNEAAKIDSKKRMCQMGKMIHLYGKGRTFIVNTKVITPQ